MSICRDPIKDHQTVAIIVVSATSCWFFHLSEDVTVKGDMNTIQLTERLADYFVLVAVH
jgi:hypothetical protein